MTGDFGDHGKVAGDHGRAAGQCLQQFQWATPLDKIAVIWLERHEDDIGRVVQSREFFLFNRIKDGQGVSDSQSQGEVPQRLNLIRATASNDGQFRREALSTERQGLDRRPGTLPTGQRAGIEKGNGAIIPLTRRVTRKEIEVHTVGNDMDLARIGTSLLQIRGIDLADRQDHVREFEAGIFLSDQFSHQFAIVRDVRVVVFEFDGRQAVDLEDQFVAPPMFLSRDRISFKD